jgi:hypothetical protein
MDPRFSRDGFYGRGLYLTSKAGYSNNNYAFDHRDGTLSLMCCRAALGDIKDYGSVVDADTKNLTMPPLMNPASGRGARYHSVKGGPYNSSSQGARQPDSFTYVVYETCQTYPDYIVRYTPGC